MTARNTGVQFQLSFPVLESCQHEPGLLFPTGLSPSYLKVSSSNSYIFYTSVMDYEKSQCRPLASRKFKALC